MGCKPAGAEQIANWLLRAPGAILELPAWGTTSVQPQQVWNSSQCAMAESVKPQQVCNPIKFETLANV